MVAHHLAKVRVAGSNPVFRSRCLVLPRVAAYELAVEGVSDSQVETGQDLPA